jgi:hypothetical protein
VKHWIKCPATVRTREKILALGLRSGIGSTPTNPMETLAYAKESIQRNP